MASFNKAKLDGLAPASAAYVVWDQGRLPGFGLKVTPAGRKVFILDARIEGRSRRVTLGRYGPLTLDGARKLASQRLTEIAGGIDPTAAKRAARSQPNVGELCDLYLVAADAGLVPTRFGRPKKAATIAIDRGMIDRHIKPLIGSVRADRLSRADVQRMIDSVASGKTAIDVRTKARGRARVSGGKGIATRTAELLGGIWSWAAKRGHVTGPSPATGTDRFRSQPADRRLSEEELRSLGRAMREAGAEWASFEAARVEAHALGRRAPRMAAGLISPQAIHLFKLIAFTGMRPGEVMQLRWEEIDYVARTIALADSKTGRSKRPLSTAAMAVLHSLDRTSDRWVFPAMTGVGPTTIKKPIAAIFSRAKVHASPKVLRSTFASVAADLGFSGGTIAELLGHARQGVTERHYIRRVDSVVLSAADQVATRIAEIIGDLAAANGKT